MDLFDKCYEFTYARTAQEIGLYPFFIPLSQSEGPVAYVGDHRILMCGANNYLGLTTHPRVRQASIDAIKLYGTSCTGSRFANGTLEIHTDLERRLAEYVGKETALVFSTGYQVNVGVISGMDWLSRTAAWLSEHEAAISAVAAIIVIAGVVFARFRRLLRRLPLSEPSLDHLAEHL